MAGVPDVFTVEILGHKDSALRTTCEIADRSIRSRYVAEMPTNRCEVVGLSDHNQTNVLLLNISRVAISVLLLLAGYGGPQL